MIHHTRTTTTRRRAWAIAPAVLALAFGTTLAACGDDDGDDQAATEETTESTTTTEAEAEFAEYCDAVVAVETVPDPDIDFESLSPEQQATAAKEYASETLKPLADEVATAAPEEVKADIDLLVGTVDEIAETGDFSAFETPEVQGAEERTHAFDLENCGWERVDVTAVDYAFEDLPTELPAGVVSFELTNDASVELHEIVVLKKNEGTTETAEELIELPEEEALQKVTEVANAFAEPGGSGYTVAELEPGDYIASCFIPVGSSAEGGAEEGPPHAVEGMLAEFTVA